jgi:alpha-tubulin suppressor-like RCC1 family protein
VEREQFLGVPPATTSTSASRVRLYDPRMKLATCGASGKYQGCQGIDTARNLSPVPATVFDDSIIEAAAAYHFVTTRTAQGRILGVGGNGWGMLGDGTNFDKADPVDPGLERVLKVVTGGARTVALDWLGRVWTFGVGPMGDGIDHKEYPNLNPVLVPVTARDIFAGGNVTACVRPDGGLTLFGGNMFGQLGDGTKIDKLTPFDTGAAYREVASGGSANITGHSLFLRHDGLVEACGANNVGQSAQSPSKPILTRTLVPGLTNVVKIYAGFTSSGALTSSGDFFIWGKLPDGTVTSSPTLYAENVTDAQVGVGVVFVVSEGFVSGAGNNDSGQLGDGTRVDKPSLTQVPGVEDVLTVCGGQADNIAHTVFLGLEDVKGTPKLAAAPIAGGVHVAWLFGPTLKPWVVKHRIAKHKEEWTHDGQLSSDIRSYDFLGLTPGVEYELWVSNGDFGNSIGRATPL